MHVADADTAPVRAEILRSAVSLGAFAAELATLAILAASGARLGPDTVAKISVGVALPVAALS